MPKKSKLLSVPLIMAACVTEGAFSLVGMLLCLKGAPPSVIPALAGTSALFAVTIEGEVFAQNISPAVEQLLKKEVLLRRRLRLLIAEKFNLQRDTDNSFLKYYAENFHALRAFKELHVHKKEEKQDKRNNIAILDARLYWMERMLLQYFQSENHLLTDSVKDDLAVFEWDNKKNGAPAPFFKVFKNRKRWMLACNIFNMLSLIGCFLCDIYMSNQFFLFFGLSATASSGGFAALIIVSALSAWAISVMFYQAYTEIIANDLHKKYWRQVKTSINTHIQNKSYGKMFVLGFSILIFSALFAAVMLGTVGTWWKTGLGGQAALFKFSGLLAATLVGTFTAAYTLIMAIFTFKNIVDTFYLLGKVKGKDVSKGLLDGIKYLFDEPFRDLFCQDKSLFQKSHPIFLFFLVPLLIIPSLIFQVAMRFVYKVYATLSFVWHCISEGATTDKAYFIPARAAAVAGAIVEGATDFTYIHEQQGCSGHEQQGCYEHEEKNQMLPSIDVVEDDGHSHANLAGKLFVIVLSPVLMLMCGAHSFLSGLAFKECWKATAGKFWSADHHHDHHHSHEQLKLPKINKKVEHQRGLLELKQWENTYEPKSKKKSQFFQSAYNAFKAGDELPNAKPLSEQRSRFSVFQTKRAATQQVWNDGLFNRLKASTAA